ncbi:MAG: hypothetical protein A2431_02210 [Candidatus Zambryskibacteria bacterium RIFOXYC1_FULL_39_10]|uniref:FCP1 homology domain-containing protein n=1 Tax=Candidatus Zambryskibacteria bacterium RIFOXYC1_FULL_39_10 TaxID=1802779 RepID=A0A1G2V3Q3_9BACT|nr:MAG: hypothetical protein A2431_02210 [Candidatus Zambryskibacteria bacterium RIFOXYC1_FULL_39_10]OHB16730.1 MAG: hypothetical protein A2605_01060 [Candidatus Zambryskibacteria bacterium RIFOXYD1_FULL_39_35]
MENKIKLFIFDWGGTLCDLKTDIIFKNVHEVLSYLSKRYKLVLVSLAVSESSQIRSVKIQNSEIAKFFTQIIVGDKGKDQMYEKVLVDFEVRPEEVVVVDNQVVYGIKWGNSKGATTVWLKNGEFENDLPNSETGMPSVTINNILELKELY